MGATSVAAAVVVRTANDQDLERLADALGQVHYFRHRISRQPRLGSLLLAEEPGSRRILGDAFVRTMPAEEWELRERLPNVPILSHVEVVRDARNQGIGTAMISAAEQRVARLGRRRIALGVNMDNPDAYRLYTRLGYAEWDGGPINAVVEQFDQDGRRRFSTEKCHVLVKNLLD
ncbi:GNAT family N-acetyltransferase [Dactylosporangium sp. NPDC051541]|uniref:GNAT family N-acetyltransferase n=1 Tax=Dactylosporangium sp. NPDC051541 TaxID=3363977 RepID=UPI00379577EE